MVITDIKKDKQHLCRIMLSNGAEILIDTDLCLEKAFEAGEALSEEEIKELQEESDYRRAKSRAMWYLDRTDYTEKALYEKLVKAGFKSKASAKVMAKLTELGIVDDRRYAERYAERLFESNISRREALNKLYLKGVPSPLAKEVTAGFTDGEAEQIRALLEGKYARKLCEENGTQKVFAALARKGFDFSVIRSEIKKYSEEIEFDGEF